MRYATGLDSNWYLVFSSTYEASNYLQDFTNYGLADFDGYDNAIQLTNWDEWGNEKDDDYGWLDDDEPYDYWEDDVDDLIRFPSDVEMDAMIEGIYK